MPITGPRPVGADGIGRARQALVLGKVFFHPRQVTKLAITKEQHVRRVDVPIKTERLRSIAFLLPEEADALEVDDFFSFPTGYSYDAKRMASCLLSSPRMVSDFPPVRVEEVTTDTYTHPVDAVHDSTRLKRGETYVKVFVKPAGPLKPSEVEELGAWTE